MHDNFDDEILKEFQSYYLRLEKNDLFENYINFFESFSKNFVFEKKKINEIYRLKNHLNVINNKLGIDDYYFGEVFTLENWRESLQILKKPYIGFIFRIYFFVIYRVITRIKFLYLINSFLFKKNRRLISKSEVIGRFIYHGFDVVVLEKFENKHFFIVKKKSNTNTSRVSSGIFFSMQRIGKSGKTFRIFKLRTMHPYSEFVQNYMVQNYGYSINGKLNNDFRMTNWARVFRKYWLDELPQILNLIKGDMKLVGIRPVSESYFTKIPLQHQKNRFNFKPGCIPPYLALNFTSDIENVLKAERIYIQLYKKKPIYTDFVFMIKAIFNIFFNKRRSN